MEFKCIITAKAEKDLAEIIEYITVELYSPVAATRLVDEVGNAILRIAEFPESCGRVYPEFFQKTEVRRCVIGNYLLFYTVNYDEKQIYVLRIIYGKRDMNEIVKKISEQ